MPFDIDNTNKFPIRIPDATTTKAGVMSATDKASLDSVVASGVANATRIFQPFSADVPAPTNVNISTQGATQVNIVTPAGKTKFRVDVSQPVRFAPNGAGEDATLVSGGVLVEVNGAIVEADLNTGLYTVAAGQTVSVFGTCSNLYNGSPAIARANQWGFFFTYSFQ